MLKRRNAFLKRVAESEEWRRYLEANVGDKKGARVPGKTVMREWDRVRV
jgi:hypothetical protein